MEIGFKRKPNGDLASFVEFSILNQRVENAEEAFKWARLFQMAPALLECVQHAEAQMRVQIATLRAEAKVRHETANLAHAKEIERWANAFAEIITKAEGKTP